MSAYERFLDAKQLIVANAGVNVSPGDINPKLFPFQRTLVQWALRKGRSAIFSDCGTGKTFMQLEWARLTGERGAVEHAGGRRVVSDVVVTLPQWFGLVSWVIEGDAAGTPESGEEWDFSTAGPRPDIVPGERVYVTYKGHLIGYAPLVRRCRAYAVERTDDGLGVTGPMTVEKCGGKK